MIVSLNEIETTVLKAARGAGMAWGLAEEAAQAARWLAARRLAFEPLFVLLFETEAWRFDIRLDSRSLSPLAAGGCVCPIRAGACLSDLDDMLPIRIERPLCPLLLAPFAARSNKSLELAWKGTTLRFSAGGVASPARQASALHVASAEAAELRLAGAADASAALLTPREGGLAINVAAWSKLQNFEAKTYVPASLESQLRGAGAALSDND